MRRNLRILFFQKLFSPGKKLIPRLTCNEKNTGNNISTTVCIQEIFCIVYMVVYNYVLCYACSLRIQINHRELS